MVALSHAGECWLLMKRHCMCLQVPHSHTQLVATAKSGITALFPIRRLPIRMQIVQANVGVDMCWDMSKRMVEVDQIAIF